MAKGGPGKPRKCGTCHVPLKEHNCPHRISKSRSKDHSPPTLAFRPTDTIHTILADTNHFNVVLPVNWDTFAIPPAPLPEVTMLFPAMPAADFVTDNTSFLSFTAPFVDMNLDGLAPIVDTFLELTAPAPYIAAIPNNLYDTFQYPQDNGFNEAAHSGSLLLSDFMGGVMDEIEANAPVVADILRPLLTAQDVDVHVSSDNNDALGVVLEGSLGNNASVAVDEDSNLDDAEPGSPSEPVGSGKIKNKKEYHYIDNPDARSRTHSSRTRTIVTGCQRLEALTQPYIAIFVARSESVCVKNGRTHVFVSSRMKEVERHAGINISKLLQDHVISYENGLLASHEETKKVNQTTHVQMQQKARINAETQPR